MLRKVPFVDGEYYHVFNRGVNKMNLFLDECDYQRFFRSLYLFNDFTYKHPRDQKFLSGKEAIENFSTSMYRYVDVISFCLMPNHFHLLLRQRVPEGISKFLQRVCKGFARYFNAKHIRTGPLFEGRFGSEHIKDESQYDHISRYIHLNPLDLTSHQWREGLVDDWKAASRFLKSYKWSSHQEFLGTTANIRISDQVEVKKLFPDRFKYEEHLRSWSQRFCLSRIGR